LVLFVFLMNALRQQDPLQSFLFALALAVGLTPEFLPMIVTVTLSAGAQRMARDKVIVRQLESIENLGNMDVLCSDKTGTLTRGVVTVEAHVDTWGHASAEVLRWARVNSALETGMHNALDAALLAAGTTDDIASYRKLAEVPYDFERRRVSVLTDGPDGCWLLTKGAPEQLLALCSYVQAQDGQTITLADQIREQAQATLNALDQAGFHVLAITRRGPLSVPPDEIAIADERDLTLCGFVAFLDPPEPSAPETLASLVVSPVSSRPYAGTSGQGAAQERKSVFRMSTNSLRVPS
jgi:Mg2+-importing ATPase